MDIIRSLSMFLFSSYVIAGHNFYVSNTDLDELDMEQAILIREKDNEHDKDAIAIFHNTQKIGYIPKKENIILARLLDNGYSFETIIRSSIPSVDIYMNRKINE